MAEKLKDPDIYRKLFERGLGELPILRNKDTRVLLGNLVMDKGALVFRDRDTLAGVSVADVAPCWDLGLIGAVADIRGKEWDSLSFLGPELCKIPVNLSSTRHNVLRRVAPTGDEDVFTFFGSVYRGFKMMLDSNLLPLILPLPIETQDGVIGLAVTDFRYATVSLDLLRQVNDLMRVAVDRQLTLSVEEVDVDDAEFNELFAQFKQTSLASA
jgi:hypothetical protein